jgi:hypothetical protein
MIPEVRRTFARCFEALLSNVRDWLVKNLQHLVSSQPDFEVCESSLANTGDKGEYFRRDTQMS